ncbi:MAG TPA: antitoxin VapB family protein [Thermoplasmata archaeon]
MTVKTITVTQEAYRRLKAHKTGDESFSDVILRLTKRRKLTDFAGILSPETADAMRRAIDEDWERRRRVDETR